MDQQFDWIKLLIEAARHSPQALDFVRKSMSPNNNSEWRTYPPSRSGSVNAMKDAANELNSLIFDQRLVYSISFQCTPESNPTFGTLLDALYKYCPLWRFHPKSSYIWTEIANDGSVSRSDLEERIESGGRTQGGFRYERIDALVNQEAYVVLKVMCRDLHLVDDFSDLIRFR